MTIDVRYVAERETKRHGSREVVERSFAKTGHPNRCHVLQERGGGGGNHTGSHHHKGHACTHTCTK